jgi:hypothetical protein
LHTKKNMNRFAQIRSTTAAPLHPALQHINPRMHNQLEKPIIPAEPKKSDPPIRAHKEEKKSSKGSGLSTDRKEKVLEFLQFNL